MSNCLIKKYIRDIPNFPKKGIILRDLTMCLTYPPCYDTVVDMFIMKMNELNIHPDAVIGIEAKGFIWGAFMSYELQVPLIMVRKQGKLPGRTKSLTYSNEYANPSIEVDIDTLTNIKSAIFVDDVLATGGTALAVSKLLDPVKIVYNFHVIQLNYLAGKDKLKNKNYSIIEIES